MNMAKIAYALHCFAHDEETPCHIVGANKDKAKENWIYTEIVNGKVTQENITFDKGTKRSKTIEERLEKLFPNAEIHVQYFE